MVVECDVNTGLLGTRLNTTRFREANYEKFHFDVHRSSTLGFRRELSLISLRDDIDSRVGSAGIQSRYSG
jgi:hypothetical protein